MLRSVLSCCALVVGFGALGVPAEAYSYLSNAQTQAKNCRETRNAGQWATSLPICLAAAETFKAQGDAEHRNPWYSYEIEGEMLENAAIDYAGLKRHREALDTAIRAHDLLLYTYHHYQMDDSDYAEIAGITQRLARFEAQQRALI
jgi:hypothetical protein